MNIGYCGNMNKAQKAKHAALESVRAEMAAKKLPLMRANLVFGEGDPGASVIFVGEAPGANEDIERRPFVGRGGKLLDLMLEGIGWKRESVYITNVVKRRPPDNRDPSPREIKAYRPYLVRQIDIIRPKVIVPLGRFAMGHFLPDGKISRDQGKAFAWGECLVYPIFHPAAALRSPKMMKGFRKSFRNLPKTMAKMKKHD